MIRWQTARFRTLVRFPLDQPPGGSSANRAARGHEDQPRNQRRWRQRPPSSELPRAGRYFLVEAVLTSTTRLPGRMNPRSTSSGMAARVAAPSGDQANRRSCHWSWITVRIASSDTASARPPVCLRIRKTLIWPTFWATFNPVAIVVPGGREVISASRRDRTRRDRDPSSPGSAGHRGDRDSSEFRPKTWCRRSGRPDGRRSARNAFPSG